MRLRHHALPVLLAVCTTVPSIGWAQTAHIADASAQQATIQKKISADDADRAVVARVLGTSQAQAMADRLGVDLTQARNAAATLEGTELAGLATYAREADTGLSGGSNTIVISTTTLLLGLILLLLIVR